ncbi:MAG: SIP domain-containing protein [Aeromicrobium sp.]
MGRTLGLIADRVDAQSIPAVVVGHEPLGANLTRLVLSSPAFASATTDPCDVTAFRVSRTDFRHYTPAVLDQGRSELTIIVHRHGEGLGEELVAGWSVGDEVKVCQWSSTRGFRWHDTTDPVVLLGDATVISLAMAFADRTALQGRRSLIVLEVDEADVDATRELVASAVVVPARPDPGAALDAWLAEHTSEIASLEQPMVYLAGHGQSIQRQRVFLRQACALERRRVSTQPFWATGRSGL